MRDGEERVLKVELFKFLLRFSFIINSPKYKLIFLVTLSNWKWLNEFSFQVSRTFNATKSERVLQTFITLFMTVSSIWLHSPLWVLEGERMQLENRNRENNKFFSVTKGVETVSKPGWNFNVKDAVWMFSPCFLFIFQLITLSELRLLQKKNLFTGDQHLLAAGHKGRKKDRELN